MYEVITDISPFHGPVEVIFKTKYKYLAWIVGKIHCYKHPYGQAIIRKEKMRSYTHHKVPKFIHDCAKCQFLVSIEDHNGNFVDVYKSCDASIHEFLLRHGPDDQYITASLETLVSGYMYSADPNWRKEQGEER